MLAAGVDGCRLGWIQVARDRETGEIGSRVFGDAAALLGQTPRPDALAIDVPIGLLEEGVRACDVGARRILGARRASVFTAPIRPLLGAAGWKEACAIRQRVEGKKIPKQLWGIVGKVREVDDVLRADAGPLRERVYEVHPEVSFRAWSGAPMAHPKKRRAGREERLALVTGRYGADAFARARDGHRKKDVADDDLLDAFAALWTAERILEGAAQSVPTAPPRDDYDLPMQIVF